MLVTRRETADGVLQTLRFQATDNETAEELKQEVKNWIVANYAGVTWENFFDRLISFETNNIIVDMT